MILADSPPFCIWLDQKGFCCSAIMLFSFSSSVTVDNTTVSSPSPRLKHYGKVSFACSLPRLKKIVKSCLLFSRYESIPSFLAKYLDFSSVSFFLFLGLSYAISPPPPPPFFPFKMLAAKTVNHLSFLTQMQWKSQPSKTSGTRGILHTYVTEH